MFASVYAPGSDQRVLLYCVSAFSPLVEATAASLVVLNVDGCDALFGSDFEIAKKIAGHAVAQGLKVKVAVASE